MEKDRHALDSTFMSEIDQTMKKHADNLLHALEAVSARLTQLETWARNLENSVEDLKVSVGNNHGSSDGKMRQSENILREVIRDKQEILETQFQQAKAQAPLNPQMDALKSSHVELVQPSPSLPAQPFQQPTHGSLPQSMPTQPNLPPVPVQVQNQFPAPQSTPAQWEPYFPQPGHGQNQEAAWSWSKPRSSNPISAIPTSFGPAAASTACSAATTPSIPASSSTPVPTASSPAASLI